jgi:uncharacterized protein (TIGR03435 family)
MTTGSFGCIGLERSLLVFATTLAVAPLLSQTTPTKKPSFEVVSIKQTAPGNGPRGGGPRGDRFAMTGVTLRTLLESAYQRSSPGIVSQLEIIGGPNWIDADRYDVEAKADCNSGPITREQYQLMIQSLVEDRFQLKARLEPRDVPAYELVVARGGPKIKPSEDQTPVGPPGAGPPSLCAPPPTIQPVPPGQRGAPFDPTKIRGFMAMQYSGTAATAIGTAVPISILMIVLRLEGGRPIIDKTDLKGLYDFRLQFNAERMVMPSGRGAPAAPSAEPAGPTLTPPAAADPVPSLLTAIQEQLGLKLESSKAPIEALVIESVQRPKDN